MAKDQVTLDPNLYQNLCLNDKTTGINQYLKNLESRLDFLHFIYQTETKFLTQIWLRDLCKRRSLATPWIYDISIKL